MHYAYLFYLAMRYLYLDGYQFLFQFFTTSGSHTFILVGVAVVVLSVYKVWKVTLTNITLLYPGTQFIPGSHQVKWFYVATGQTLAERRETTQDVIWYN